MSLLVLKQNDDFTYALKEWPIFVYFNFHFIKNISLIGIYFNIKWSLLILRLDKYEKKIGIDFTVFIGEQDNFKAILFIINID